MGTALRDLRPEKALGHNSLAWVVFYRIGLASGCVTGWRIYVEPLLAPGQNSGYVGPDYIVTTPARSRCDRQSDPRSFVALPHFSEGWHLLANSVGASKIQFTVGCSPTVRLVKVRRGDELKIQVIIGITTVICPQMPPRTVTVASPLGAHLAHGPTGYMPAHRIPLR